MISGAESCRHQITDLTPLIDLNDLRVLSLADNQITDVQPLTYLDSIEIVDSGTTR